MTEMLKKLKELGRQEVFKSEEALRKAAFELGYDAGKIDEFIKRFGNSALGDDELKNVSGGAGTQPTDQKKEYPKVCCKRCGSYLRDLFPLPLPDTLKCKCGCTEYTVNE